MWVSVDIVGDIRSYLWSCVEAVIVIKNLGVKLRNAKEEFIRGGTLGEGHIICKGASGGVVLVI